MPIETINAAIMLAALLIYVLLGGADYGAGVWDLFAAGPRKEQQREAVVRAIGPIWEANHVWLIVIVVLLFTCFPAAFSAIMTALHVPVTLALLGIVFRGSSFVFRTYTEESSGARSRRWGLLFSIASICTPVLLGVVLGTASTGSLRWNENGAYISGFFQPWLQLFPWSLGLFTLAIFAFLAAVYLCVEVKDNNELADDFRRRGLAALGAVVLTGALTSALAGAEAPYLYRGLTAGWWSILLHAAALFALGCSAAMLQRRRFVAARTFAAGAAAVVVSGYGAAMHPYLVVRAQTIAGAAAPAVTQMLVLSALGAGALILLPSLYYLFRTFKGQRAFSLLDR